MHNNIKQYQKELNLILMCISVTVIFNSFRIGFVLVVNDEEKVDGYEDAGIALFRVLNYITEEYDVTQAFLSMLSVSNNHFILCSLQCLLL